MSSPYNPATPRPHLKDSCNSKLQIAFSDGQWTSVVTMAKQLAKTTKDSYYEAVEAAARSQLDSPADHIAALTAVEKLLSEKKTVKDANTLDLYDWACSSIDKDYSKTIGALRVSFVKASGSNNKDADKVSFYACLNNDDLENAQQISALMDNKYPKDARFGHWKTFCYYILSKKIASSDPMKARMSSTLAQKLSDKARELHDKTPVSESFPLRAISNEEEMRLWWTVQINAAGSNDNLKELLKKPQFDALKILSRGYLSVFKDIMQLLETLEVWDEIYRVCREVFDKAIIIMAKEQLEGLSLEEKEQHKKDNKLVEVLGATQDASNAQSQSEAEDRAYSNAAVDLSLWIQFIYASRDQEDKNGSLNLLRHFIDQVIKVTRLPRFYQKQKAIANLTILFAGFESSDVLAGKEQASSTRVDQLVAYVSAHYRLVSCFSDIKQYVEKLRADEAKEFLQRLSQEYENADNDAFKNVVLQSLHLRFRYLLTTTDQAPSVDLTPGSPWKTEIEAIAKACATVYNKGVLDKEVRDRVSSSDVDPFSDVAIIGATCLLKLAGLTSNEDATQGASLQSADLKLILQAIAWLAKQYDAFPIKSQELPVLLTKLYFLIGCITQAKKVWATLDIKNVTLDSLGPLFADRLSTVAPGLWTSGSTTTPMFPYVKYYTDAHKRSIPSNVRNALETGSCGSALGIMNLQARLRHSCTLLMAAVEDRRGVRAATGKSIYPIDRDPLLRHITLSSDLVNATDYDSLPNHESSKGHLSNIVNLGPSLSAPRVKLALFTEELLSVISYRDPKDYKPAKAAAAAEQEKRFSAQEADKLSLAIEETLRQCKESAETSWPVLTEAELAYFGIVSQLAAIVALYARGGLAKNAPRPAHSGDMVAAAVASLQDQIDAASSAFAGAEANNNDEDNDNNNKEVLYGFATLHTLGMLRESATAMKLTAAFVEKTVGNASASAPKWVAEDLRALHDGAGAGAELVRKRVKVLNEAAAGRAWLDTVCGWAFGDLATSDVADEAGSGLEAAVFAAAGGRAGLEITAGQIKDSWQEVAKGWAQIKLD